MLKDTYKLLASVTVVRELYDSKQGVYDVLAEFIKDILEKDKMRSFTVVELTDKLNANYSFGLNTSVVKTCLKHMKLVPRKGFYTYQPQSPGDTDVDHALQESQARNDRLFASLISFIEEKTGRTLTEKEKRTYKHNFCDFLLQDNPHDEISNQYFHEFILTISRDDVQMQTLNQVKEGTLIYEGIRYSSNISEIGSWNTRLNLFLDTEILFAIGGYNSDMYQDMYAQLQKYFDEINRGCPLGKQKIQLWYFPEVKREIEYYFNSAERIVRKEDWPNPTKEAMNQIVNGCSAASDVQMKRARLFQCLKDRNIRQYDKDFYSDKEDSRKYNLESQEILDKYAEQWGENPENLHRAMQALSHIHVLRKGANDKGFENCGYILLTATGRVLRLANIPEYRKEGDVPLATTFDFLINHFWFKLNKGFGTDRTPRSLDMVMRSRQVLASIINHTAAQKYDEYRKQFEQDELSEETFCRLNADLHQRLKHPDDVEHDSIGNEIEAISNWSVQSVIESQKKKDLELANANVQILKLENTIRQHERQNGELAATLENVQHQLSETRKISCEKEIRLQEELKENRTAQREMEDQLRIVKLMLENTQKEQEEKRKKAANRRYKVFLFTMVTACAAGAVLFAVGMLHEWKEVRFISALLELSGLFSLVCAKIKKHVPSE